MSGAAEKASNTKTPADFLKSIRGRPVVVKLNSGVDYRGILACLDGYMNIAMEQTGIRQWSIAKQIWGCLYSREQCALYKHIEEVPGRRRIAAGICERM